MEDQGSAYDSRSTQILLLEITSPRVKFVATLVGMGNHPCRKCLVGGPQKLKETNLGFHNLFQVSHIFFMFLPQLIDFSLVFLALPRVYTQM